MFKHEESIVVNHSIDKVYQLVANVENYPQFIPWCTSAKLLKVDEEKFYYFKLNAKFGFFSQDFITKDQFYENEKIIIDLVEGPFKSLYSVWKFKEMESNKTLVDFYIEFEFKSVMLTKLLGKIFLEANKKILISFLSYLEKK